MALDKEIYRSNLYVQRYVSVNTFIAGSTPIAGYIVLLNPFNFVSLVIVVAISRARLIHYASRKQTYIEKLH